MCVAYHIFRKGLTHTVYETSKTNPDPDPDPDPNPFRPNQSTIGYSISGGSWLLLPLAGLSQWEGGARTYLWVCEGGQISFFFVGFLFFRKCF